jgi:hypothetical protein
LFSKKPANLTISIFNILGNRVFFEPRSMNSNSETFVFNTKELSPGIYFIQIDSDYHKRVLPLIMQ